MSEKKNAITLATPNLSSSVKKFPLKAFFKWRYMGLFRMAQWAQVLDTKTDDFTSIPRTFMVTEEN